MRHDATRHLLGRSAGGVMALALCLCMPAMASDEDAVWCKTDQVEAFDAGSVAGVLSLPPQSMENGARLPVVILIHDAFGPDLRAEWYIRQLTGATIAVLGLLEPEDGLSDAGPVIDRLAEDPRFDGKRLGILGFGAGAAVALRLEHRLAARALLYPGCSALASALPPTEAIQGVPWLLMHGDADPANSSADCGQFAALLARQGGLVRHVQYRDAGYAWDRPAFGAEGTTLLPMPGREGRVRASPWPEMAVISASNVASFFARSFNRAMR